MEFLILRVLTHSELGMFHEYRRQGKERSRQRAVNFDGDVVARVFPAATSEDRIEMDLRYLTDDGLKVHRHWLKRQEKNWRLEGNCPQDRRYAFVEPGCLFVMQVEAGVSPATGSWIVLAKDDPLSRAILSDGATGGLTAAGMIALHGREGERIVHRLAEAMPKMFVDRPETGSGGESTVDDEITEGGIRLPPRAERLTRMLGEVGHTLPSAVAELVDNAITADATRVDISFGRPDQGHGRWMTITDNGDGMSWEALKEAMRLGSNASYADNSLGKYGYGLKGASWSQATVLTVVTRTANGPEHHLTWDRDAISDDWVASTAPLEDWIADATRLTGKGTAVLWRNMTPPVGTSATAGLSPFTAEIRDLDRHLGLVFHRFLEGRAAGHKKIEIFINGVPVEPNNPVGHPLVKSYDAKSVRMPLETGDATVEVRPYLLPSEEELKLYHQAEGPAAAERALDRIGLYGRRTETQGLFIYRNDRLIRWGGWHDMWSTTDEKTKLARVTLDFGPALDDAFGINISKQIVHLPKYLQDAIKPLAKFVRTDSQKKFRRNTNPVGPGPRGGTPAPSPGPGPSVTPVGGIASPPSGGGTAAPTLAPPPPEEPKVVVRPVTTSQFIWKVGESLSGDLVLQVSTLDPNLSELARLIAPHPQATLHLARFLQTLDTVEAQETLLEDDEA
jgi:hypothetical protein